MVDPLLSAPVVKMMSRRAMLSGRDANAIALEHGRIERYDLLCVRSCDELHRCQDWNEVFQGRLAAKSESGNAPAPAAPPTEAGGEQRPGGGFGGFGGGRGGPGGRGGMGGQDYSSLVAGDGKLYFVSRNGDIFVIKPGSTFEQLSVNRLTDQQEDFSASPAISGNQIFIRSSKHLYCVSQK